jgi:hypothetical protein
MSIAPGRRNRAASVNVFQELYLAGPDPSSRRDRCGRSAKEAIWRSVSAWKMYSVAQGGQIADYNLFERRGDRFAKKTKAPKPFTDKLNRLHIRINTGVPGQA